MVWHELTIPSRDVGTHLEKAKKINPPSKRTVRYCKKVGRPARDLRQVLEGLFHMAVRAIPAAVKFTFNCTKYFGMSERPTKHRLQILQFLPSSKVRNVQTKLKKGKLKWRATM